MNATQKLRLRQIRLSARVARALAVSRVGRVCMQALRSGRATRPLLDRVLGFHRAFPNLGAADAYIADYANEGHQNPKNVLWHLNATERAYLSDYPALFHILLNQPAIRTVFDLGGNAGNVFYRYDAYMGLPSDLRWTVCDLAKNIEFAETYARDRQEGRLRFTTEPAELDGCDLLLASGSLHYFENPLAMVSAASRRPAFILVNRSPLTERDSFSVVQDVGDWLVACVVHNRARLYQGLQGLGYELRDEWTAPEFHIEVAGSPALSVPAYSGFFMALRDRLGGSQPARKRDA